MPYGPILERVRRLRSYVAQLIRENEIGVTGYLEEIDRQLEAIEEMF